MSHQKKLWELPEWKATRKRLLKNSCGQCGSVSKLTLAHTKPFPKAIFVGRRVKKEVLDEKINAGLIQPFELSADQVKQFESNLCPKCNSKSIRVRKVKQPKYACISCKHEFKEANMVVNQNHPDLWRLRNNYYNTYLEDYKELIDNKYQQEMDRLKKWYLSGEDTITLCNSCAYALRKGLILCKKCGKKYHQKKYEQCYSCNTKLCIKCNENRVSTESKDGICDNCAAVKKECRICKKQMKSDLSICDDCVLAGHWVEE